MRVKFFILLLVCTNTLAQDNKTATLFKDLDGDSINDQVFVDQQSAVIVCKLSSQQFRPIKSKALDTEGNSGIRSTKSGFEFYRSNMRDGYACQFRYSTTAKQIQLIGMSRYEFGSASNDGSGKSSLNLLTHSYIGNWNYYDDKKTKLISIPVMKQKLQVPTTYLSNYSDAIFYTYQDFCTDLFIAKKAKLLTKINSLDKS